MSKPTLPRFGPWGQIRLLGDLARKVRFARRRSSPFRLDGPVGPTIRSLIALSRAMLCKLKCGAVDARSEARCPHMACDVHRHLRACWREAGLRTSSVPRCWASIRYAQFAINSRFLWRMASLVSSRLGVTSFRSRSSDEQEAVQWCERLQPACR